jgi:hypothetical protein
MGEGASVLNRADDDALVGPVEDVLARHGPSIGERVERGAWQNIVPDDIWARVVAVWDRRGWDRHSAGVTARLIDPRTFREQVDTSS